MNVILGMLLTHNQQVSTSTVCRQPQTSTRVDVPTPVLHHILAFGCNCPRDIATASTVCNAWKEAALSTPLHFTVGRSRLNQTYLWNGARLASLAATYPRICSLDLTNQQLTDAELRPLSMLTSLQVLSLHDSFLITDVGLPSLSSLLDMRDLNLRCGAWVSKITDLRSLSGLTRLENLSLHGCHRITDDGLQVVSGFAELRELNLTMCQFSGRGLRHLSGLVRLERLMLAGGYAGDDAGLQWLAGLVDLSFLDLSCSRGITGESFRHLAGLTSLGHLDVSECCELSAGRGFWG